MKLLRVELSNQELVLIKKLNDFVKLVQSKLVISFLGLVLAQCHRGKNLVHL